MEQETPITFNDVPAILGTINQRLSRIERTIQPPSPDKQPRKMMTIEELLDYLPYRVKKETIYKWRYLGKIPFYKQGGNLIFDQDEIDAWLTSEQGKTQLQMIDVAQEYAARASAGIKPARKGGRK